MNSQIQFKANTGQINIDSAQGIVECFVAGIGNKDSVGDIVVSGAFTKSLMRRKPRVVWGHNWNDPIGKVLEIYEVPPNDPRLPAKMKAANIGGLFAKVQFNLNSEKGKEAFANIAFFGEEQEWSIGYKTLDAIYDNARQANVLREVELYEVSPVLHGANQLTGTISVKSEEEKNHIYAMGMPSGPYQTMPRVAPKPEEAQEPRDPFSQGIAMPLSDERTSALKQELINRTGGPIDVMKATDSSVVFNKPGRGVFRLSYYFDGNQFMFGKPEPIGQQMATPTPRPQNIPSIPAIAYSAPSNPENPSIVFGTVIPKDYEKSAMDEVDLLLDEINQETKVGRAINNRTMDKLKNVIQTLQNIVGAEVETKSSLIVACDPKFAFKTKQLLDPVFDYHRVETLVTENGIVITSDISADAYNAIETATKGIGYRIGRALGSGGGPGKARRARGALSRIEGIQDPRKRRDVDNDGLIFDGTWREMAAPARGLRSSNEPNNPLERKINASFTRSESKKTIDAIEKILKDSGMPNREDTALHALREQLIGNQYKNDAGFQMPKSQLDNAIKELTDLKNANFKDEYLEKVLATIKEGKPVRSRAGGGGRKVGTKLTTVVTPTGEKVVRKKLSQVQPDNWGLMSLPEKEEWLITEAPKLGLDPLVRNNQLEKIAVEMDDNEKKLEKGKRRAANLAARREEEAARKARGPNGATDVEIDDNTTRLERATKPELIRLGEGAGRVTDPNAPSKFLLVTDRLIKHMDAVRAKKGEGAFRKSVVEQIKDTLNEVDNALSEKETIEALQEAEDAISKLLSEMNMDLGDKLQIDTPPEESKMKLYLERVAASMASRREERESFEGLNSEVTRELDPLEDIPSISNPNPGEDYVDYIERPNRSTLPNRGLKSTSSARGMRSATNYLSARSRRKQGATGLRSTQNTSTKQPRTEINAEATWWNKIESSLGKEISKASDKKVKDGLTLLQTILRRQESGKLGAKRTNAGALTITADEADQILDAVMSVVDRQVSTAGSRGEIFAELLEKVSSAAMSTFIEKTTEPIGRRAKTS